MTVLVHESVNSLIISNVASLFDKKNKLTSMFNNYNLLLLLSYKRMEWFEKV